MRRVSILLGLALLACAAGAPGSADCRRPGPEIDVAVGVREAPPFISTDPIRGRRGLNLELWQSIERQLQAAGRIGRTAYVECSLGDQIKALAGGDLDLVIAPLTITSERMEFFDFTHQYLSSGITVAQRTSGGIDFGYAAGILRDTLGQRGVPRAILFFLAANLLVAAALAWALRRDGAWGVAPAGSPLLRVLQLTVESVVRTIGLKGIGDSARSITLRSLEIFMAVVGTALSATIFGVLTTALVGSVGGSRDLAPQDLAGMRVATLVDSTSQTLLEEVLRDSAEPVAEPRPVPAAAGTRRIERVSAARREPSRCVPQEEAGAGARCVTTTAWRDAMILLAAREVDAVLGDWAQLSYLARQPQYADRLAVQGATFQLEPYGWGVSRKRPELRAAVDRALMQRLRSPEWRALVQDYMGSGSISPE